MKKTIFPSQILSTFYIEYRTFLLHLHQFWFASCGAEVHNERVLLKLSSLVKFSQNFYVAKIIGSSTTSLVCTALIGSLHNLWCGLLSLPATRQCEKPHYKVKTVSSHTLFFYPLSSGNWGAKVFFAMAYILDENKVRLGLPKAFKDVQLYLQQKEIVVDKIRVETANFSKEEDSIYTVSGFIKVSIVKEDGIYEDLYSYTTKITVNKDDEIENCENIYLNKLS
ncbi:MAG: hypothetical protein II222_02560 [Paraprevotella sp.]|nr:hypothetical protein [Paraprevotella sp.]